MDRPLPEGTEIEGFGAESTCSGASQSRRLKAREHGRRGLTSMEKRRKFSGNAKKVRGREGGDEGREGGGGEMGIRQ